MKAIPKDFSERIELVNILQQTINQHPYYIPSGWPLDKWQACLDAILSDQEFYEHIKSELEKWDYCPEVIEDLYVTALKAP